MGVPQRLGWRMATTEAGLATNWLFAQRFPPPTSAVYRDYSTRVSQSTGGQVRHGYKNVRIFWEILDRTQALFLRTTVQGSLDVGGLMYWTIDRANGTSGGPDWIDISAKPYMPDFDPTTPIASASAIAHRNIELFLNSITIVNAPAVF